MRIYIRRHQIHLGYRHFNQRCTWKRIESFGWDPVLLKRGIPKKNNVATASEEKNPLFGRAPIKDSQLQAS